MKYEPYKPNESWRENFTKGVGRKAWCEEEYCDNTFIRNNIRHRFCAECRKDRDRVHAARNYREVVAKRRREARNMAPWRLLMIVALLINERDEALRKLEQNAV